nr:ParB-like partition protein [Ochrobactrum phage ORM_20]
MSTLMVSRYGFTLPGLAEEILDATPSTNMYCREDPEGEFIANPIRYDMILAEKLEKACSIGLVLCDQAEDVREIPFNLLVTDQKVVVKDKVHSLVKAITAGELNSDNLPIAVNFEYENLWIIRDGNHRAAAQLLLGMNSCRCKTIHVKHSFL